MKSASRRNRKSLSLWRFFLNISPWLFGSFAAILIIWFFWPRDQRVVVRETIQKIASQATFEGELHPFAELQWADLVAENATEDFQALLVSGDRRRVVVSGRRALAQQLAILRHAMAQLVVGALWPEIEVKGDTAVVTLTGRALGRTPGREDYFLEEHALSLTFKKHGGDWLLARASNSKPIPDLEHLLAEPGSLSY